MLPQVPPPPPTGGAVHAMFISPEEGKTISGYLAGPAMWFWSHQSTRTKPCLHVITGGVLHCPRCVSQSQPCDIGYVPIYREVDGRPCFVLVHEHVRESLATLKLHERVVVGRERGSAEGVWVQRAMQQTPRYHSTIASRYQPLDLSETLLRVWNLPELTRWYREHGGHPQPAPVIVPPSTAAPADDVLRSDGEPYSPVMQAAARRWGQPVQADSVLDAAMASIRRKSGLPEPSSNGRAKAKGDKSDE